MRPWAVTPRQRQVLELRAQGLTAKQIGQVLWVSEETVKSALKEINRTLAARNSTHAVAIGYQTGMLS